MILYSCNPNGLTKYALNRLRKITQRELADMRGISSVSGTTAALAMDICQQNGWSFRTTCHPPHGYYVERIPSLDKEN